MSDNKNIVKASEKSQIDPVDSNLTARSSAVSSIAGSVRTTKTSQRVSSSSERQIKYERAQKCLENAALVSKKIKEHQKAAAELLGRPIEEDDGGDTASEITSIMSEKTGYFAATDTSTTMSIQDALNIPGISESLANTLKQKELLMERIKQYKEISKRPITKSSSIVHRESAIDSKSDLKKSAENNEQLINAIKEKENILSVMQVKMKAMETTILDLQEKINEKDQIIEAKNKATTLMSDSLSKKEKDSLALLEDTRQQMTKMQENFITMENEWKEEKQRLIKDINTKEEKIKSLEEANSILESSRFEISVEHAHLLEKLESKDKEITHLEEQIVTISQQLQEKSIKKKDDFEEEKGSREIADMSELTKKVELLEQLNCQIRQTNKELENKLTTMATESKAASGSPTKKGSPLPTRKTGRKTANKSPWSQLSSESLPQETDKKQTKNEIARLEMLVQSLNKDILDKEYVISQKDEQIMSLQSSITHNPPDISPNLVDIGVNTETTQLESKPEKSDKSFCQEVEIQYPIELKEYEQKIKDAENQITLLNNEIDAANKNMIKVKSNHKLKLKQMQKTIDNFSKVSDTNAEIVKLNEELHHLTQKVAELEEEKGNLQLHLVDYDSGRLTESDIYKKLVDMENLAEMRLKVISALETQKFDLVQELHTLQQKNMEMEDKLADISQLQSEQVSTEIKSVQLEEQIDALAASKKELELIIENLKLEKDHFNSTIKELQNEKEELNHKLESYVQENMELSDKLEKLSAEKVSSAESIEIVESLTTQEKLELEEYNKCMTGSKIDEHDSEKSSNDTNIDKLIEQREELSKKIELFMQEREEVMDKMSKITSENEDLHSKISDFKEECLSLQNNLDLCSKEKSDLQDLNIELSKQIEELKRERIEIIKETVDMNKPASEEAAEVVMSESQHDEKAASDKVMNRTKSVKQLTKEILKLKNTIKEREAEIGDCQMKILSLEEQQQKQNEILQAHINNDIKMKLLADENQQLKDEIEQLKKYKESEQQLLYYQQVHERLQHEAQSLQQEYSSAVSVRDARINELENILVEYEKQIFNYGNTLQQKDKELTDYINQITKLNDVSQKLKSTIDLLEEEKAKDQNAEFVKSLNKQIISYQNKISDIDDKIRTLEEEKLKLTSLNSVLENQKVNLEAEVKRLQDNLAETQIHIKELQAVQQKHLEELATVKIETKERDEEIHEIKLQLRKESIENEKLRNKVDEKDIILDELMKSFEEAKEKLKGIALERDELNKQFLTMENKNKELMEKLKKFAINIKKKSSMYADLENKLMETQKELELKLVSIEQLSIQVDTLPALQEKVKFADEEINRLQSQKLALEVQKSQDIKLLQDQIKSLEENINVSSNEVTKLSDTINILNKDLHFAREENSTLKSNIDLLNNKIVEYEIEQKNNTNLITKVAGLETEINQKQNYITELLNKLEVYEQQESQTQFGYDAKIQERDLYIESLETEISKYKSRICRLEESISTMEQRRHSLERKADQLDNQLQEKQKAYVEYTSQEDELVGRLAVLIDHDSVVEKQLLEIDSENKELQLRNQQFTDENLRLRKSLADIQEHCNTLVEKASKTDLLESELSKYQLKVLELEAYLKRTANENQTLLAQKIKEIEDLEFEFNTQIEKSYKEKKSLIEKYEKKCEHVAEIELKLQQYQTSQRNLEESVKEVNKVNQELIEKSLKIDQTVKQDYTDQYVSEINNLKASINNKNQEIEELTSKIQTIQTNNLLNKSNLESNIAELTHKLQQTSTDLDFAMKESIELKQNQEHLQSMISQKDDYIKDLKETKTLTFEMNIPKTEGMFISSTIEPMNEEPKVFDVSNLESQILSDTDINQPNVKVHVGSEVLQKQSIKNIAGSQVVEPAMVSKKAYQCYQDEVTQLDKDPFNSDEGWGLGENEEIADVTPGLSHLNEQIRVLTKEKEKLKEDFDTSNSKLMKAIKKLRELKYINESLSNELRISKQISQSSFLDSAIEDELRLKVQELEKKLEELNIDINKERKEKDSLRKQNEVFNNANDKLTEIKEKLDSEIELWKYKFKEANDKITSLQWSSEAKDSPRHETIISSSHYSDIQLKEEIVKFEKENDELQLTIDELTSQNNELLVQQIQLKNEIENLKKEVIQKQSCDKCELLKSEISSLHIKNEELLNSIELLNTKLQQAEFRCNEALQNYDLLKADSEKIKNEWQIDSKMLTEKCFGLEVERERLSKLQFETNEKLSLLTAKLDDMQSQAKSFECQESDKNKVRETVEELTQKCLNLDKECTQLRFNLEEGNKNISILEIANNELSQQSNLYSDQISELNVKLRNLNTENDNLLSTVAELRSSVSTAVDQRGFEIAELWKHHLAQRENDFQKIEFELRNQLTASEAKYEQLLDNVQSSSQEETNKLIMAEQVNSLQIKLLDKEEHLRDLQDKYAEIVSQLDMLRSEMQDEKITYENKILEQQEEYEKLIEDLNIKNKEFSSTYNDSFKTLQTQLAASKTHCEELVQQIEELNKKLSASEEKLTDLNNQLRLKDSEVYQKINEYTIALSQRNEELENLRQQVVQYEKKLEELTFEKESELAVFRLKMHEHNTYTEKKQNEFDTEKSQLVEELSTKIVECTNLNKQIADLNKALEEYSSQNSEMQTVLENQELEIVTLKDEITNFESLLRSSASKIQKRVSFAIDTKPGTEDASGEGTVSKELLDAVPRAELDLALYMLHQRDVRCEELTMELTQLLEERDTLQLRLSDSLRITEEFKAKCKDAGLNESIESSQERVSELPTFTVEREQHLVDVHRGHSSRSSSVSEHDGDKPKLQAKLSELRTVRQSRDVRLRQESEQRQWDMRLLQRDVANLPPEAVEQLTQAHHTLSRDSQSTSTVLLNWLRGKSTPKVVHM